MSFVSFIIPSIGRKTLVNSIRSLERQTNSDWDALIIIDGPVSMEELNILNSIDNPKVSKIFLPEKLGNGRGSLHGMAGLVRNKGMALVNSEWLAFLDDDDTLDNHYVEWLKEYDSTYDLVLFRMLRHDGSVLPPNDLKTIQFGYVGISFAVRKELVRSKNIQFTNSESEDFDFLQVCCNSTGRFIISPHIAYYVNAGYQEIL